MSGRVHLKTHANSSIMKNSKLNIQANTLANAPKQQNPPRLIFNAVLLLLRVAYLWSIHHVAVANVDYMAHFFGLHYHIFLPIVDTFSTMNEFLPRFFCNNIFGKIVKKFPKYNLIVYVLFSIASFITCSTSIFWVCVLTVSEELIIGFCFHKILHDKHQGFKMSIRFYHSVVSFIKNIWS